MKKNILVFGTVLGTILCIMLFYIVYLFYNNPDFKSNDILGYAVMVFIFSLIFFGVRNYRNKELDGIITFGKAFKVGILIALLGSTMYVVVWLFYYYLYVPDFLDKYIAYCLKDLEAAELAKKTEEMEQFREMYKNPFFVILITYSEVFPIGLIVTLISALTLKKKNKNKEMQKNII